MVTMGKHKRRHRGLDIPQMGRNEMLACLRSQGEATGISAGLVPNAYAWNLERLSRSLHRYPKASAMRFLDIAIKNPLYSNIMSSLLEEQGTLTMASNLSVQVYQTPLVLRLASGHAETEPVPTPAEDSAQNIAASMPAKLKLLELILSDYKSYGWLTRLTATKAVYDVHGNCLDMYPVHPSLRELLEIDADTEDDAKKALERLRRITGKWEAKHDPLAGARR